MFDKKITKKEIDSVIKELKIDPKNIGALSAILDVGNPEYYSARATEAIRTANSNEYDTSNLILATQLLVINICYRKRRINEAKNLQRNGAGGGNSSGDTEVPKAP